MSVRSLISVRMREAARARRRAESPAELARHLDPKFRVTPTIWLLSSIAVRAVREPDRRDAVSTPPRTGKSQLLVVWFIVWALMVDPDMQIIVAAYADDLAEEHSRKARKIIRDHSGYLGYQLAQDKTAVKRWTVDGHTGGLLAAGIQSGITGMGADLLIVDDPVKNQQEADSKTHRTRVFNEYQSTLAPRVHPGGSTLIVQTRWQKEDLIGKLLAQEPERWQHTNIPAVSEAGIPDALGRPPGVAMVSALGFTAQDFVERRRTLGERSWYALYMGVPSTPEGGLVKAKWLRDWRMPMAPASPVLTVVGVDPSDSGQGDSCGLVAAASTREGVVALIADVSAPMTSDQWARAAVELAVEVGASEIAVEGFAARETYTRVVRDALKRAKVQRPIRVTSWPPKGSGRGGGDAIARSAALLQALEVGTARLAGHFPEFEAKAIAWQVGQHQPDNLAAFVVAHDVLVNAAGATWQLSAPPGVALRPAPVTGLDWARQRIS